jgi:sortase A
VYLYQVREGLVVKEEDVEVTGPSATPQLTLVTCSDWDSKTETYLSRRVVIADLVDVRRLSSVRAGASASP